MAHLQDSAVSKLHPRTGYEGPDGEQIYSSTLPLTLALDGVGGQLHAPATLPPGKTWYPLCRRLGELQGRSGQARKISPPPTPAWIQSPDRPAHSTVGIPTELSCPTPDSVDYITLTLNPRMWKIW